VVKSSLPEAGLRSVDAEEREGAKENKFQRMLA